MTIAHRYVSVGRTVEFQSQPTPDSVFVCVAEVDCVSCPTADKVAAYLMRNYRNTRACADVWEHCRGVSSRFWGYMGKNGACYCTNQAQHDIVKMLK